MKRNFIRVLIFTGILALAGGCAKKDSGPVSYRVKSVISSNRDTLSYTYDAQGQITSFRGTSISCTYSISGSTMAIYLSVVPSNITATLNANGRVSHIAEDGTSLYPGHDEYLTYDAAGALISDSGTVTYSGGSPTPQGITLYTWSSDSNLVSVGSPGAQPTYTYTYLTDVEHRDRGVGTTAKYPLYTQGFFSGKNSRNLIHVETYNYNGGTDTYTHSYTFDSKGRIATDVVVSYYSSIGSSDTTTYTYSYY